MESSEDCHWPGGGGSGWFIAEPDTLAKPTLGGGKVNEAGGGNPEREGSMERSAEELVEGAVTAAGRSGTGGGDDRGVGTDWRTIEYS